MKRICKASLNSVNELFAESQALYSSTHPHVVQVHYACYDAEHVYIAMPYYRNGSIKDLINGKHLTIREIIELGSQTLAGLHNIHSKGLIHFDIKPDNILLSPRNEALVSDFGLAKQINYSGVAAQDRHYTPMMPPEALKTDQFDRTFDIYQFGATLYRMCNGNNNFRLQLSKYGHRENFDRDKFRFDVRNGKFPDRKSFAAHVPSTLRKVINKCLEVDIAKRYQSALDIANAMAGIDGACLDWRLSDENNQKIWTKKVDETQYELTLRADGSTMCYKTTNGGNPRRVADACKVNVTDKDVRDILSTY